MVLSCSFVTDKNDILLDRGSGDKRQMKQAQATVSCYTKRPPLRLVPHAGQKRNERGIGYFTISPSTGKKLHCYPHLYNFTE